MNTAVTHTHLASLGVVIVAAGRGERLGADRPKAFVDLDGHPLLEYAVRTVVSLDRPGHLVLVVPEDLAAEALELAEAAVPAGSAWQLSVVGGGRERHESVRKGLDALREGIETVLVHDAARPLAPASVFERVADEVQRTGDGVIPAVPVVDTLKRVDASGTVRSTADRRILVAVQTPQGFPFEVLAAAHESAQALESGEAPANDAPTDDAEVVQRFGGTVRTITGDPRSHKLTTREDLLMLHGLLGATAGTAGDPGAEADQPGPASEMIDEPEPEAAPTEQAAEAQEIEATEAEATEDGAPEDPAPEARAEVPTQKPEGSVEFEAAVDWTSTEAEDGEGSLTPIELPPAPAAAEPNLPAEAAKSEASEPEAAEPAAAESEATEPEAAESAAAESPAADDPDAGTATEHADGLDEFERLLRGID